MKIYLLLIFCFLSSVVNSREKYSSAQFSKETVNKGYFVFLNLPHTPQLRNYCVPASVTMVLDYYGHKANQKSMALLMSKESLKEDGTSFEEAISTVKELGFDWTEVTVPREDIKEDIKQLKEELDNKRPVVLGLILKGVSHASVLVGYDEQKQVVFTLDPGSKSKLPYPGAVIYTYKEFEKVWRYERMGRDYIKTKRSDKKIIETKSFTKAEVLAKNKEILLALKNNISKTKKWGLTSENVKGLNGVKLEKPIDILKASQQSRASELRKVFEGYFQDYLELQYSNNKFPVFVNESYISSVMGYDQEKKAFRLLSLERKSMKLSETLVKEYKLKTYLAYKLKSSRYALYSYQFNLVE